VLVLAAVVGLVAVGAFVAVTAASAARQGNLARFALLRAESRISERDLDGARAELVAADTALAEMKARLDRLGPLRLVALAVPVVRSQLIAVETIQSSGVVLASAGLDLADAAEGLVETRAGEDAISTALTRLGAVNESLGRGAASVRTAAADLADLDRRWLPGPVGDARDELAGRLPDLERRVTSAAEGLDALLRFAGAEGDRRYLFLSQNPDEIRPTGGFIGTYGLISMGPGAFALDRFEPIHVFLQRHPTAVVPAAEAGSPFRFVNPPRAMSLANVNSTPDFAAAGRRAVDLWNGAGEPAVDGAFSVTPAFMARLLEVLGPVDVPDYGERVTAANIIERFDFYTDELEDLAITNVERKGFVASLAEVVMDRLLAAPANRWQALGDAMAAGFDAREAMAWSTDEVVAQALANRNWDGTLPEVEGDFFYNGEWSYAAKFNRGIRRTFDHHVQLRDDGSARITTTMVVANTRERSLFNPGTLSYVTLYGPAGAVLDPAASDPPVSEEPAVAGHPGWGWFVNAPPLGRVTLRATWTAEDITRPGPGGARDYSLTFLGVPDHTGDVLNLRVEPPPGWRWQGDPPPAQFSLDDDVRGSWRLVRG
jgi:hypothetical protein